MIKSRQNGNAAAVSVTFTVDPQVGAQVAAVCGEWNGWSPEADVMQRQADGSFSVTIDLTGGRSYRFRYLLDGERWDNDWAADDYVPNEFGADDSLVDLTALAEPMPPATKKATGTRSAKKAPAVKETAAAAETSTPTVEEAAGPAKKSSSAAKKAAATAKRTAKKAKTSGEES